MPNRYSRDQLIKIALDMVHLPNLAVHDAPHGVVQHDAYCIQWLQDILDWWYSKVPFSATLVEVVLNATALQGTIELPENFIVDMRHGYMVETIPGDIRSYQRRMRLDSQAFLTMKLQHQRAVNVNFPLYYCIQGLTATGRQLMQITPTPTIATQGRLPYYALPEPLEAGDIPPFPASRICIEYLRIRALEWQGIYEPGTAEKYCDKLLVAAKASGLMNEPESNTVTFGPEYGRTYGVYQSTYAWMGPV
jgi:hypothetical protein